MQDSPNVEAIIDFYLLNLRMPGLTDIGFHYDDASLGALEEKLQTFIINNKLRPPYHNPVARYEIVKLFIKGGIVGPTDDEFKLKVDPNFYPSPETKKFEASRHYRQRRNRKRERIKKAIPIVGKTCPKCGQYKLSKDFYQDCPETSDGLSCRCRKCKAKQTKENRQRIKDSEEKSQQNREKKRKIMANYRRKKAKSQSF